MGFAFLFDFVTVPRVIGDLAVWDAESAGLSQIRTPICSVIKYVYFSSVAKQKYLYLHSTYFTEVLLEVL